MNFYKRRKIGLVIALITPLGLASLGCRDRSRAVSEVSTPSPAPTPQSSEADAKDVHQPGEAVLNKLLTVLLTGEGRPIDVENELAGRNLETLRKAVAERMTPEGLPVSGEIDGHRVQGYFKVNEGIIDQELPAGVKPFIIGVSDGENTWSIAIFPDHEFTYYLNKDSFFVGFGSFKH